MIPIPAGHRVLVKRMTIEERDEAFKNAKQAGIVFAQTEDYQRRENGVDRGEVIAIGEDAFKEYYRNAYGTLDRFKPWCRVGDYGAFAKYSAMAIKDQDTDIEYLVLNDADIVAIIEEPK